ncbi:astacin-like metalloendopeptidase isoform X2 [Stylophora pistillata]|uniref:astacin-like metalloendopeptidase isoform X2 n=1 Tax=Stylophora pistillata TaxID=50429 RepID=UPI000C0393D6|nr:astacin-like metalloendopeptidase isoform X2 [Stylophora pistillata]
MSTKFFSTSAVACILIFASCSVSTFDVENESQEASNPVMLELYDRQMQGEESLTNIRAAIKEWQDRLCIVFKERRFEDDYVEFAYEGGCSSSIGRIGGRQVISVGSVGTEYADVSCRSPTPYGSNVTISCSKGSILHEIGHALGFYHEHNRPDRDMYVTVVWDNVMPGCRVHFRKERFKTIYGQDVPYDYNSVMHYGSFFFARERGMRTLHAKVKGVDIGQRERLSTLDIQKGRMLYQCDNERGSKVVGVK